MRGAVCNSLKWGQWTAGAVATSTSRLFNSHISLSSPQRQGHGILVRALQQSQWRKARRRWWQRWGWPGGEREGSKWPKSHWQTFSSTKSKFPKRVKYAFFFAFNPDNFTPGITRPSSIFKFDFGGPAAAMAVKMLMWITMNLFALSLLTPVCWC